MGITIDAHHPLFSESALADERAMSCGAPKVRAEVRFAITFDASISMIFWRTTNSQQPIAEFAKQIPSAV